MEAEECKTDLKELSNNIDNNLVFRTIFLDADDIPETYTGPRGGRYTESIIREGRPYRRCY